jgi:hypothetical protein
MRRCKDDGNIKTSKAATHCEAWVWAAIVIVTGLALHTRSIAKTNSCSFQPSSALSPMELAWGAEPSFFWSDAQDGKDRGGAVWSAAEGMRASDCVHEKARVAA